MDIAKILIKKYPNAVWVMNGNSYDDLEWKSELEKPKKEELELYWEEVQKESQLVRARKNRAIAYREESDPIFMKFQRGEATKQEWLDKIEEIKQRFPKPE